MNDESNESGIYALCAACQQPIVLAGEFWDHLGPNKPRHPASPVKIEAQQKDAAIVTSAYFFELLAKLLGDVDPAKWYRVTIEAVVDQPISIKIERWATDRNVDDLVMGLPQDALKASVKDG
jgi:hypothetical protein